MSMALATTAFGPSTTEIVELYHSRRSALAPVHAKMATIKDQYNNLVSVPLPELDKNETPGVANLISQGVDQMAMRVASTVPSITYPPVRPGIEKSENLARIRRLANYAWWDANHFDRKQRRRAKHLIAYAATPVMMRPNFKKGIPLWQPADPMMTFPAPMPDPDDICPDNVILAYRLALSTVRRRYPDKVAALELGHNPSPDTELEMLEYNDGEVQVLVVLGRTPEARPTNPFWQNTQPAPGLPYVELERFANRVGRCTVTYATRPSLECPISQFDGMPAVYKMQARAMALWLIASERAIFPDTWFVSRPNETVDVLALPDGRAGIPGQVKGGDLKEVTTSPPPGIGQIIEMLERNQRVTAGISSDFGGENPSNVRTGRAGEQLLSATVDYWVQEAQETLSAAYTEENKLAVAIARCYFGDIPQSFYVSWKGAKGPVDYIPNVHFENDNNIVQWPMAGSDINQLVVGLGQRLGLDEMSIQSAQEKDPYIDDPEEERRRLTVQSVNKALMAAIDQQVAQGQIGPKEIADFAEKVIEGRKDLYRAYQELHDETQEQQSQMQAGPGQGGPQPGSPQTMPGLSAPGQQAALGMPAPGPAAGVSQPPQGLQHMQQLIGALRGGPRPAQPPAQAGAQPGP